MQVKIFSPEIISIGSLLLNMNPEVNFNFQNLFSGPF